MDTPEPNAHLPQRDDARPPDSEQWYAVVDASGNLVSLGTVLADSTILAGDGLSAVMLTGPPDLANNRWDPAKRVFVPVQVVDRVADFIANHQEFWNALSANQQAVLETELQNLLGSMRYRSQFDPPNIP